jgi:hypothetical protein
MSHLPLMPGDDIAIFLLAPNYPDEKDGLTCYPTDRYVPIGFPIFAEYDDDVQVRNIREINEHMTRYLHEFATVYNKKGSIYIEGIGDSPVFEEYKWNDIEDFVRSVIYHELYVEDRNGNKKRLEHVMVHTELYTRLLQNMSNRIPYGKSESYADLMYSKVIKTMEWLKKGDDLAIKMKMKHGIDVPSLDRFSDKINIGFSRWNSMDKMAKYYLETDDGYILDHIVNYILWATIMNYSRYGYHCISGAGSQCQEMMLQKIIAEFVIEKCSERERDKDEDYDGNVLEETLYYWDK